MSEYSIPDNWPEQFSGFLETIAHVNLDSRLRAKLDASDVVQQTFLQAHNALKEFRGASDAEFAGWLRQILLRVLSHAVRDFGRHKRNVDKELDISQAIDQTTLRLELMLEADQTSPLSGAIRNERWIQLIKNIELLPIAQREAIILFYVEGCGISEICQRLEKTPAATAGLLKRGLRTLRENLR